MHNIYDQFFLKEEKIRDILIASLELKASDKVLEIGAGNGFLTEKLVLTPAFIYAVEIDKKFKESLLRIKGRIKVIFGDALKIIKEKDKFGINFNKLTGSLPSSIVEPLAHLLVRTPFESAVFLVPLKFAFKIINHLFFEAFFETKILERVSRHSFVPVPRTNWALIKVVPKADPLIVQDKERFLRQYLYFHPKAKVANALAEGLIVFFKKQGKFLSKKQAKEIIKNQNPLLNYKGVRF